MDLPLDPSRLFPSLVPSKAFHFPVPFSSYSHVIFLYQECIFSPKLVWIFPFTQATAPRKASIPQAPIYIPDHCKKSQNFLCPLLISLVNNIVWDNTSISLDAHHELLSITLKFLCLYLQTPIPSPLTSIRDLKTIIQSILSKPFQWPTSSPYNTPILAVRKI